MHSITQDARKLDVRKKGNILIYTWLSKLSKKEKYIRNKKYKIRYFFLGERRKNVKQTPVYAEARLSLNSGGTCRRFLGKAPT